MKRAILPLAAFVALVSALVLGSGCGFASDGQFAPLCISDEQCGAEQVCFPDGCGDPGAGIRVEVTPNVQQAYYAQDFEVPAGELKPVQNLSVHAPSAIAGRVERNYPSVSGSDEANPYSFPVTVTADGESALIPGIKRRFTATVSPAELTGSYRIPVSSGLFTVAVSTIDTAIPPTSEVERSVDPGEEAQNVDFRLPASSAVFRVDGRLVRTGNLPVQTAEMEVQAYDPVNHKPLSQRVPASSGQTGSTGDFNLFLSPDYRNYELFYILATPKDPTAMVPVKRFQVRVDSNLKGPLELGDYGLPIDARGIVLGQDGQPIANATVYVDGPVNGGGDFKSQRVVTNASGEFTVRTLATRDGEKTTLWVAPPGKNAHGLLRALVTLSPTSKDLGRQVSPTKPMLKGRVLLADDQAAAGVRVVAEAVTEGGAIVAPAGAEIITDNEGAFSLALDPGTYRLDFIPTTANLPRASRTVTVLPTPENIEIKLSRARTVTGVVASRPDRSNAALVKPVPYASVRFFRVSTQPGQKSTSVLLAESVADAQGNYTVTLPTRQ